MNDDNETSFAILHKPGLRMVCLLLGAGLLGMSACGAMSKVSEEGWEGPSSQPGAAHQTSPRSGRGHR